MFIEICIVLISVRKSCLVLTSENVSGNCPITQEHSTGGKSKGKRHHQRNPLLKNLQYPKIVRAIDFIRILITQSFVLNKYNDNC